jgi:hypothetical protein
VREEGGEGGRWMSEGLLELSFCCYFVNSKREQSGEEWGKKEEGGGGRRVRMSQPVQIIH